MNNQQRILLSCNALVLIDFLNLYAIPLFPFLMLEFLHFIVTEHRFPSLKVSFPHYTLYAISLFPCYILFHLFFFTKYSFVSFTFNFITKHTMEQSTIALLYSYIYIWKLPEEMLWRTLA